jgi:hypothetical protein
LIPHSVTEIHRSQRKEAVGWRDSKKKKGEKKCSPAQDMILNLAPLELEKRFNRDGNDPSVNCQASEFYFDVSTTNAKEKKM